MTRSAASDGAASGRGARAGYRYPRAARLRSARDIRRTRRRGRRRRGRLADVYWTSSPLHRPRVGIVTPRYGRTAVERNRVRRQLREIARLRLLPQLLDQGLNIDVLVRAKPAAYGASYVALCAATLSFLDP